jgi:transcriptional regulator with XRE-family HTH domain
MDVYALLAALEDARETRGSGIPLSWGEIAEEMGIHQAAFSRLKQGRLPGPKTLRAVMEWLEVDAAEFKVGGSVELPIGGRDEPWDGEAATNRVFTWATEEDDTLNVDKLRQAFFFIDTTMDLNTRQAYKLPFCDVGDGGLHIVPRGMSAVSGGHGLEKMTGASKAEKEAIKRKVCAIYKRIVEKYDDWPDCPFSPDGTRPERKERRNDAEGDGVEFKDYSPEQRDKMAKNGEALPDGSFPIADCADLENAISAFGRASDKAKAKAHIKKRAKALDCDVELPEDWAVEDADEPGLGEEEKKTAGIIGTGSLSKSEDPRTQALVARVQELLREGAVAVSIKHDLHPEVAERLAALEPQPGDDETTAMAKMEEANEIYSNADIRPRHVAIVDTAAFSNSRLALGEDGFSVSGPVTFEGIYTGDVRTLKYGSLTWDDDLLPIPIIWDPDNNDHDGVVVGYVDNLERVDGMTTAVRPEAVSEEDIEAVTAAAGSSALPAEYFADFKPKKAVPLTITEEDENGLRHVYGIAAPKGVCHRSDMGACFQYPGDVDPKHRGFHTGQSITLSDGSTVRVGALTIGGKHIDASLARQGVSFQDVNRHRDDANTVFAMVRAWETPHGLAISGVVMPGVDRDTLMRAMTLAPSVELWPAGRGRTLVGVHLVPTPAWPVAASAGGDVQTLTTQDHIHVIDPEGGFCAECGDDFEDEPTEEKPPSMSEVMESLKRIEKAVALLAEEVLTDVPLPEDSPEE